VASLQKIKKRKLKDVRPRGRGIKKKGNTPLSNPTLLKVPRVIFGLIPT